MSEKQLHQWCYSTCVPLVREITFQNGEVGMGVGVGVGVGVGGSRGAHIQSYSCCVWAS